MNCPKCGDEMYMNRHSVSDACFCCDYHAWLKGTGSEPAITPSITANVDLKAKDVPILWGDMSI